MNFYLHTKAIIIALGMWLLTIPIGLYLLCWLFFPLETLAYSVVGVFIIFSVWYYISKLLIWINAKLEHYSIEQRPARNDDDETANYGVSSSEPVRYIPLIGESDVIKKTLEYMQSMNMRQLNLGSKEYVNKIRIFIEPDEKKREKLISQDRFISVIEDAEDVFDFVQSDKGKTIAIIKRQTLPTKLSLNDLSLFLNKNLSEFRKFPKEKLNYEQQNIIQTLVTDLELCRTLERRGLNDNQSRLEFERLTQEYFPIIEEQRRSESRV